MVPRWFESHAGDMTSTPTAPTDPGDPGGPAGPSGPEDPGPRDPGPRLYAEAARDLSGLRRTVRGAPEGRHIGGVAGGVARHFDIDPMVVRVALVVLSFFGGAGLLLYAVGWLLIPEEGADRAVVRMDGRSRTLVLYVVAGLAVLAVFGDTFGGHHIPWPLAVVGLVVLVILGRHDRLRGGDDDSWVAWPRTGPDAAETGAPVTLTKDAATTAATTAAPTTSAPPTTTPLTASTSPTVARPPRGDLRDPRKRGPVLFGLVLAAIALAEGVLGLADVAGANVARPAYPALALGIIGAGLVLGAFWGRAGGLITLGLIGTVALVGSVAANEWDVSSRQIDIHPTSATALPSRYDFDLGEAKVDLTGMTPAELAGRTLRINGNIGRIEVVVPDNLAVYARASVNGPGQVDVFDADRGGFGSTLTARQEATGKPGAAASVLTIDASLDVGQVQILNQSDPDAADIVRSSS